MNRLLKFRAWGKLSKHMRTMDKPDFTVQGEPFMTPEFGDLQWFFSDFSDDYEVMQYTGLKDKNGVEIYEGDIVKEKQIGQGNRPWIGIVGYRNGFCWLSRTHVKWQRADKSHGIGGASYNPDEVEVLGNIYENPELLK